MRMIALPLAGILILGGCAGEEPPAEKTPPPDTLLPAAQEAYDPTMFDSITWESDQAAIERGSVVYNFSCTRCHGEQGRGDAEFVRSGDTLRPPSFRDPDWEFAGDKEGLREMVFVGTAEDMPHWGLEGLKPRDVDAVAIFILQSMRGN